MTAQAAPETQVPARPVAMEGVPDEEVFDQALDSLEGIDTMTARFIQVSPSGTAYTGALSLRRPGQLRFDYDDPSPQLIVATNGLVYVHDSDLETTDSYPVRETPLRFLLARTLDKEAAELRRIERYDDQVAVVLAATDGETRGELALYFKAADMSLLGWSVREPDGAVTVVELEEVETGVRLKNSLFRAPDAGGTFLRDR